MTITEDETAFTEARPSTNIERDRRRAIEAYYDGNLNFSQYSAWLARLDYQERVRDEVAESLATAEAVYADMPSARALDEEARQSRSYGKFARSL